ncbi:MAG: MFS transporter [Alphaproteobacteria bacterium]|nr:MFS transporter [Alphaproteobacteria bacterium]
MLFYSLPALPMAMLGLPMYVYVPTFYADGLGLGLASVGAVLLAARLLDVITDPLIGVLSDRTSGRLGRRRPWILAGTPILLLGVFWLFKPGDGTGVFDLLVASTLSFLGWTMLQLPYLAWGAELSPAYRGRSQVAAWREAFVVAGTLTAASLPLLLGSTGDGGEPAAERVLSVMAWIMLALAPPALILLLSRVPEPRAIPGTAIPWTEGFGLLLGNRPFRRLLLAYVLNGIANGLPATLFLLFVAERLQAEAWTGLLLLLYFGAGIAGVPLWLRLSYRIGKHRAWVASMAWASVSFMWAPLLGPGDAPWFAVICVASGLSLGADLFLPASLQADVVDEDTAAGGVRAPRTGLYFGLWGMATKLALAIAVGIAFPALELAGFQPGSNSSGESNGLFALAALYGLLPVLFKVAASWLVWRFPLDADRHKELRRVIDLGRSDE